jgi:hypothetical protein
VRGFVDYYYYAKVLSVISATFRAISATFRAISATFRATYWAFFGRPIFFLGDACKSRGFGSYLLAAISLIGVNAFGPGAKLQMPSSHVFPQP